MGPKSRTLGSLACIYEMSTRKRHSSNAKTLSIHAEVSLIPGVPLMLELISLNSPYPVVSQVFWYLHLVANSWQGLAWNIDRGAVRCNIPGS